MSDTFGCARCAGDDATAAWDAIATTRLRHAIDESHFTIRFTACACGQAYAVVFTERIDWVGGEDDQRWLAVPLTATELAALDAASATALPGALTRAAAGRRFLARAFPTGGVVSCVWRDAGFAIGPHD